MEGGEVLFDILHDCVWCIDWLILCICVSSSAIYLILDSHNFISVFWECCVLLQAVFSCKVISSVLLQKCHSEFGLNSLGNRIFGSVFVDESTFGFKIIRSIFKFLWSVFIPIYETRYITFYMSMCSFGPAFDIFIKFLLPQNSKFLNS